MHHTSVEPREPRLRLLAIAAALAFGPGVALAQASGATVIHGQASFAAQGNNLTITTANGAGTRHSAINWQSFSVPQGGTTRFNQPDAASTSINRVLGNDPSKILGTLSSNGKLVLVNPAGITVGQGAAVDTAGFTASTLRMSQADALAGRLRFEGGVAGAALNVDGNVTAQGGDVVLISRNVGVGANALVFAPDGVVVLAAGRSVEITGRGLEGIRMAVAAPADTAVNLGTLHGDAVGMFAGTLRHSGVITAVGAELDGNKLRLLGTYSSQVDGVVRAGGLRLALASKLSDKEDKKDDKNKDKDQEDKDKADKEAKDKADKDARDNRARRNGGNNSEGENGGAGNSSNTATAPTSPAAAPASNTAAAPAPAPAAVPASNTSASAPPAAAATAASAPAPAPEQAAAPAAAPVASTPANNDQPPAAVPVQAVVAAASQQQQQLISALAEPVRAPVDERKKRDKEAAAKDALQCVP